MKIGTRVQIIDCEAGLCFGVVDRSGPRAFRVDWGDVTNWYANDDQRVTVAPNGSAR